MAWIQKVTPPPNKVLSFQLENFVGGLNNRSEQLESNQATSIINMMFADETLMEKRYGQKYFDTFNAGGEVTFIDEYKPYNDTDVLIRATNSNVYFGSTLVKAVLGKISGTNHSGRYFFADGNKLYVYGKFAQATTTYEKVIGAVVNAYVLMEVTSPADGHARLDTSHVKGVLNVDYTNRKIYYEPCENEFVDTFNGANKVPLEVKYIVSHNGRLFMSGNDKDNDNIYMTQVQNPYYFPVSMPLQVPPNSDKVMGLSVYDDSVVVGRTRDLYAILGNTNNPEMGVDVFRLRRINSHTGFASNDAVRIVNNYLFFLGSDGNVYSLSSTRNDIKVLSTSVLSQTIDLFKTPIDLSRSDISTATSVFYNDEWLLSIKDKVLVYSYRLRTWTMYNQINARCFYNYNGDLLWGNPDGRTATWDKSNFLDFGVPYECHWYSKIFDMEDPSTYKQFREFYILAHTYNDVSSDVNIVFEVDYVDVKDRITVSNQIAIYGRAKWGDRYITRNIVESLPFVIGRRGRNVKFKFFNGHFLHSTVANHIDLENVLGRIEGTLVYVTGESKYYLYTDSAWVMQTNEMLNQRMKVYQINGEYELRGKR